MLPCMFSCSFVGVVPEEPVLLPAKKLLILVLMLLSPVLMSPRVEHVLSTNEPRKLSLEPVEAAVVPHIPWLPSADEMPFSASAPIISAMRQELAAALRIMLARSRSLDITA